jgi:caspase 7
MDDNLDEYKMEREKTALVLNNYLFNNPDHNLNSGRQDSLNIVRALENVGFKVKLEKNKTAAEMQQVIDEFASKDFRESDCFLCVLISHGDLVESKGSVIYGTDGRYTIIKDLIEPFKSSKALEGKPKIFLINVCRGSETVHTFSSGKTQFLDDTPQAYSSKVDPRKTIKEADMFLHYSTVSGYYSFGNSTGSWFIRAWSSVMEEKCDLEPITMQMELLNMLVILMMVKDMAKVNITGQMEIDMKANGLVM